MSTFKIDFFELAFLAEACIPPRPIARAVFWQSLTSKYWYEMTEGERAHLFEWMQKSWVYEESLNEEEDTQVFHARFNPDNQYAIKVDYNGEMSEYRAFKLNDNYYIDRNRWVADEYIVSVKKLIPVREY